MDDKIGGTVATPQSQPNEDKAALAQQLDNDQPHSYGQYQNSVQQDFGTRAPTINNNSQQNNVVSYQGGHERIPDPTSSSYPPGVSHVIHIPPPKKTLLETYLLSFVLGMFGAHHFYLQRTSWGVVYLFTFGLVGCGYVIDLFRVPYLLRKYKQEHSSTDVVSERKRKKNLSDAYVAWLPLGLFGFHHYYLGNKRMGVLYTFTIGLLGIGWIVDMFRMPRLVRDANERIALLENSDLAEGKNLSTCYMLAIPFGMFGLHHFYLRRPWFGVLYVFSLGLLGVGWVVDLFRMPTLLRRCKEELEGTRRPSIKTIDDAYVLWFPFGLLGYHHYYLRRYLWGVIYTVTAGLFGIGWIIDLCRMPSLVKESNDRMDLLLKGPKLPGPCVVVVSEDQTVPSAPPPTYAPPPTNAPPPPYEGPSEGNIATGYTNSAAELPPPYEK